MLSTLISGLTCLLLPVATCWQAAFVAQPAMQPTPSLSSDLRQVRQASDTDNQPPPGMVAIPAGSVVLGTDPSQIETLGDRDFTSMTEIAAETPRHSVTVDAFYIDTTEVTNRQWRVYLEATGRTPSADLIAFGWPDGRIPDGLENYPITNVNFTEVRDFLIWCGKRLPTEQEWVRAARGDDGRTYPWGDRWERNHARSSADSPQAPVAVGTYPQAKSPFGVLDMVGNVFEWVDSPFSAYPGFRPPTLKQGRQTVTLAPHFDSRMKVLRGGAFHSTRQHMRIDFRTGLMPSDNDAALGFRAARSRLNGLDAIRNGLRRLVPPQFARSTLDEKDLFAREITTWDDTHKVITGYRYVAFAHRGPERGPATLAALRKLARDEQVPLGVLVTSERLAMPDMKGPRGQPVVLPPGEYSLTYKGEGESREYKERQKEERREKRGGSGNGGTGSAAGPAAEVGDPGTATAPWPGVKNAQDIVEGLDYPQDSDLILYWNANNVVVGWQSAAGSGEEEISPLAAEPLAGTPGWDIAFSLDQVSSSRRQPRFHLKLQLADNGF